MSTRIMKKFKRYRANLSRNELKARFPTTAVRYFEKWDKRGEEIRKYIDSINEKAKENGP